MDLPQWLFIPLFRPSITDLQKFGFQNAFK